MEHKPMVVIGKHGVTIRPPDFELAVSYANYFIQTNQTKFDEYLREREQSNQPRRLEADQTVAALQIQIRQAEALAHDFAQVSHELQQIYKWNFVKLAEVLRKARIHMEQEQIQNMYSLKVVLAYLMEMLKAENPMFSQEQFIQYINERK